MIKVKEQTEVASIQCKNCKDIIYSRDHHDFRSCSCRDVSIDGGFNYVKICFKSGEEVPKITKIMINASKKQLFDDWNKRKNKFGLIKNT